ncbi:gliding motility-associated C-terminal domain-containing protein [Fluviicola sp.]|jgi:gliding motility-associated-like protein|uniref:T9SS type B sorting domain-containing protein n=1 Tax=Fluviicola sp. TaxID=1917219 RepID=UPI00283469B0|nr:gliding motility-associated C-terminal domain-containing protein [Fluviicola sp.]MDR0801252.1 gliding motility-associated C-terminal domain-containing protein [Fluviicola sp.]
MKKLAFFIAILTGTGNLFGQSNYCSISVSPHDTTVCPGSPVPVTVQASVLNANQAFDFNSSAIPSGWSTIGGLGFTPPCAPPSNDGTPFYWASTSTAGVTPGITTSSFDIHCPGGFITFEMIYAVTTASPCEQPDQFNEGVALQYSTNGGTTWTTITYYAPDGTVLNNIPTSITPGASGPTPFTVWNTFNVPIPPAANTTSTKFRWYQPNTSGNGFDNWGLDNIVINAMGGNCSADISLVWSNGLTGNANTITAGAPGTDSTIVVYVYDTDGVLQCQSQPVTIHIYPDNLTYNLQDYAYSYCPTTNPSVQVTNISGSKPPYTVNWTDIPSTNNPQVLPTGGAEHNTIVYHVTISDGCGFNRQDSVTLIVNKLLKIDSLIAYDVSACKNDGAVVAYVSGITSVSNQPMYNWHGPGATNPSFINSTVWTNRSPGWYYFSVSDEVCTDSDSVQIKIKNPPTAMISANPLAGCAPFNVAFENNSQNATHYHWDFGDGTTADINDLSTQAHTYSGNAQIMLIAYDNSNCSDTTYVSVTVQACGCTDPMAVNYNPTAVANDGSCIYPEPIFNIPNIFTPNGDGENDFFEFTVTNYSNIEFQVVNRWGNPVFKGSGLNPKWDGKTNGTLCEDGVYFVTYKISSIKGDKQTEGQTFVHLIR